MSGILGELWKPWKPTIVGDPAPSVGPYIYSLASLEKAPRYSKWRVGLTTTNLTISISVDPDPASPACDLPRTQSSIAVAIKFSKFLSVDRAHPALFLTHFSVTVKVKVSGSSFHHIIGAGYFILGNLAVAIQVKGQYAISASVKSTVAVEVYAKSFVSFEESAAKAPPFANAGSHIWEIPYMA